MAGMIASPSVPVSGSIRHCIILIDDDAAVLASLTFALEMEGWQVRGYPNPAALLAQVDPAHTACLVLDYRLPGTNGLELLDALRGAGVKAPAILITTAPNESVRRRASASGVVIVEKPLLGSELIDAVRRALG